MKYPKNKGTIKHPILGRTLTAKEKYILDNFPLLKFEGWTRKRAMSLQKFKEEFWSLNDLYDTESPEDASYSCDSGSSRTIIDIYMIFKYYYKQITLKEVMEFIVDSAEDGFICNDINRRVYYSYGLKLNRERDELGFTIQEFRREARK